jgi:hypothetical protein
MGNGSRDSEIGSGNVGGIADVLACWGEVLHRGVGMNSLDYPRVTLLTSAK